MSGTIPAKIPFFAKVLDQDDGGDGTRISRVWLKYLQDLQSQVVSGFVASVSGTANRISIGGTAVNPVVDISLSYIGQGSITTIGTLVAGAVPWSLLTGIPSLVPSTRTINTTAPLTGGGDLSADRTFAITAANLAGTSNQVILSASGSGVLLGSTNITLSLPQSIATSSSPTFAGLTLTGLSGVLKASAGVVSGSAAVTDLANVATATIFGRNTAGTGAPEILTAIPTAFFANPTGTIGLSAVNGTATTPMRSDAAPALSQAIVPTWSGKHTFDLGLRLKNGQHLYSTVSSVEYSVIQPTSSSIEIGDVSNQPWTAINSYVAGSGGTFTWVGNSSSIMTLSYGGGLTLNRKTTFATGPVTYSGQTGADTRFAVFDLNGVISAGASTSTFLSNTLTNTHIWVGNGSNVATDVAASGDLTLANTGAFTLASVASAGTTGSSTAIPVITINAKGLTTSISTAAVVAPAGTLTGTTLAANVVTSSITTIGTLVAGAVPWSLVTSTPTTLSGYGITDAQPLDATLTALAGLATGANKIPYSTGTDTFSQADFTASARTFTALTAVTGDIPYASGTATWGQLALGSALKVLHVNSGGTQIEWGTVTGSGNVVYSASPTFTGTIVAAAANFSGAVDIAGDFSVATSKFTVAAASGNTVVGGTLSSVSNVAIGSADPASKNRTDSWLELVTPSGGTNLGIFHGSYATSGPGYFFYHSTGSKGAEVATAAGTVLGSISWTGFGTSVPSTSPARLNFAAGTADWSGTNLGTIFQLLGTNEGTTTRLEWLRIVDGRFNIWGTAPTPVANYWMDIAPSSSGTLVTNAMRNRSNTASAGARHLMEVAGTSATGDAYNCYAIGTGGLSFAIGLDVSASTLVFSTAASSQAVLGTGNLAAVSSTLWNINIATQIDGDLALFGTGSFGSGSKVVFIKNATTNPSTNPTGGGVLYADAGALKYRGSSGTVTTLGPA